MAAHRRHLEMGTLSDKRAGVLVHRAGAVQSLARGHVSWGNKTTKINGTQNSY